ncbi:MAG: hypothetical protein WC050_02455 [Candidatus Paceibacterota bacterium]
MAIPAFLLGAAAVVVTARTVQTFMVSSKTIEQRRAYLTFCAQTLTARGSHKLNAAEIEEAKNITADIRRLRRSAAAGWTSEADKAAFERVVCYVPAARAKCIVDQGILAVDAGIASVISALESIRPNKSRS